MNALPKGFLLTLFCTSALNADFFNTGFLLTPETQAHSADNCYTDSLLTVVTHRLIVDSSNSLLTAVTRNSLLTAVTNNLLLTAVPNSSLLTVVRKNSLLTAVTTNSDCNEEFTY
jgi:hypothetical protein